MLHYSGGKSTFIASVGIAQLLTQIGSWVPARRCRLTLCDRILARVGASDVPTRGISTFMAEMLETASLVKLAGPRTLAIVDEMGRGTSTSDGFGLAWAVASALVASGSLALFATHFHELTALDADPRHPKGSIKNMHATAVTDKAKLTMLYEIAHGACDRSFGVHVARLARFPQEVVNDAQAYADRLETIDDAGQGTEGDLHGQNPPISRASLASFAGLPDLSCMETDAAIEAAAGATA